MEAYWQRLPGSATQPGGAVPAFQRFVQDWEGARSPKCKMLAIDRVIHAFHDSLTDSRTGRAAAVNLIAGRLTEVVQFLDSLAYGPGSAPELRRVHAQWRAGLRTSSWPKLPSDDASGKAP